MNRFQGNYKKTYLYILICLTYLFFFYITYQLPLTGDDWTWGTDSGIERLQSFFDGYNGRYISNILEIIFTRSDLLRVLILSLISTSLVYLMSKLYDKKDNIIFLLLTITLLLLMPVNIFSQTIGWTAGYVNYVISIVLVLFYLVITKNIYYVNEPSYRRWLWIALLPLGLITQLLVEHVSIFVVILALFVIVYSYFKFNKLFKEHIVYLISVIMGSVIMFTNKAYRNVIEGNDSYRTLKDVDANENNNLLYKIYDAYTGSMYEYLFIDSYIINIFVGVMAVILLLNYKTMGQKLKTIVKSILLLNIIGSIVFLVNIRFTLGNNYFDNKTSDFEALISLLFFASILILILFFIDSIKNKMKLIVYSSGVILLTAPFVFITPYGPRAAFASYIFMVLIGLELFSYNKNKLNWSNSHFRIVLVYVTIILMLFYSLIFTRIGITNKERLEYLNNEVSNGAKHIVLTELPHSQFMWMSSPEREHFNNMFKEFYNVPKEIKVEFVPYYKEE